MNLDMRRRELILFGTVAALSIIACLLPAIPLAPHYHDFADQRTLWGLPCALDVLSNAPFAIWGAWGLWELQRASKIPPVQQTMLRIFFWGLIATAIGSGYYHWAPDNAGLVVDRLGMTPAFAGLLGLAAAMYVSARSASLLGWGLLGLGWLSVWFWASTGNMAPWAVYQAGGMLVILGLLMLDRDPSGVAIGWGSVLAFYALAKVFEVSDAWVFEATGFISGHTIKHLVAGLAAWPVITAVRRANQDRKVDLSPDAPPRQLA